MVIAALVVFGALLAAWLLAPAEQARVARPAEPQPDSIPAGLAEAA
jgi:hypothetical protein